MHSTWQAGDPVVQLNFPNPLNVSVQVGDVAYFSNPIPVGQVQSWTATTTPHLSNPQGGIIMIGEIIQIIPWNGNVSSIICQMPQALFNQYFAQIIAGGCPTSPAICDGDCDRIDPGVGFLNGTFDFYGNIISGQVEMPNSPSFVPNCPGPMCAMHATRLADRFFFDNPTYNVNDYKFHSLHDSNFSTLPSSYCEVVSSDPFYNPLWFNYYRRVSSLGIGDGVEYYTANDALTALMAQYPALGFSLGMTYPQARTILYDNVGLQITSGNPPINGNCIENPEVLPCTQGSFIMFSKDNKVNMSDMLGYYASIELRNSSKTEAELFNVGTTFFESSK